MPSTSGSRLPTRPKGGSAPGSEACPIPLRTTTDVAAKKPELLKRTLAVMKDADTFLTGDKEKAIGWTAKAAGMKPETLRAVWSEVEFGTAAPDDRVLKEMQLFV